MTLNQSFYQEHDCLSDAYTTHFSSSLLLTSDTHTYISIHYTIYTCEAATLPMANTIILPYTVITNPHTPKRRHWRRYTTTMAINTNQKLHSPSSHFVHNSTSNLPDIVNDCHNRQDNMLNSNHQMKLTCKEIAHSLRLVADQVDKKYCQVSVKDIFKYFLISFFRSLGY